MFPVLVAMDWLDWTGPLHLLVVVGGLFPQLLPACADINVWELLQWQLQDQKRRR